MIVASKSKQYVGAIRLETKATAMMIQATMMLAIMPKQHRINLLNDMLASKPSVDSFKAQIKDLIAVA